MAIRTTGSTRSLRAKAAKTLGVLASAAALTALAQGPASAGTASWTTSYPTFGNATCSSSATLSDGKHVMIACLRYGGGYYQPYTLVMNSNTSTRLLPQTNPTALGVGYLCDPSSLPGNATRSCNGPKLSYPSGCNDVRNVTHYVWYANKTLSSPSVRLCG
ncbi:MAG: hypothetical protein HOV68_22775 [Streptomycetaceae bacterium]|nr:hypothetical protein [Streptomycetaceae bacterium]